MERSKATYCRGPSPKSRVTPSGPEQLLRQGLQPGHPGRGRAPIEDAGEIHIAQDSGQVLHDAPGSSVGNEPVPVGERTGSGRTGAFSSCSLTVGHHAPPGGVPVEGDGNSPALLPWRSSGWTWRRANKSGNGGAWAHLQWLNKTRMTLVFILSRHPKVHKGKTIWRSAA